MKKLQYIIAFLYAIMWLLSPTFLQAAVQPLTLKFVPDDEINQDCGLKIDVCGCYFGGTQKIAYISAKDTCGVDQNGIVAHEDAHYLVDVYGVLLSPADEEALATRMGEYRSYPVKSKDFWLNSTPSVQESFYKLLNAVLKK
jgi:hypothetical protein